MKGYKNIQNIVHLEEGWDSFIISGLNNTVVLIGTEVFYDVSTMT